MIGISLLTLVPGMVGGSETYARELVRGIETVLSNPSALVEKGLARAAELTWDETARLHEAVYREVT